MNDGMLLGDGTGSQTARAAHAAIASHSNFWYKAVFRLLIKTILFREHWPSGCKQLVVLWLRGGKGLEVLMDLIKKYDGKGVLEAGRSFQHPVLQCKDVLLTEEKMIPAFLNKVILLFCLVPSPGRCSGMDQVGPLVFGQSDFPVWLTVLSYWWHKKGREEHSFWRQCGLQIFVRLQFWNNGNKWLSVYKNRCRPGVRAKV